jgi:hypothetical protein
MRATVSSRHRLDEMGSDTHLDGGSAPQLGDSCALGLQLVAIYMEIGYATTRRSRPDTR